MYIQDRKNGTYLLRVTHKLLPGEKHAFYRTFDSYAEAQDYGTRLESILASGYLPAELIIKEPEHGINDVSLEALLSAYKTGNSSISDTDKDLCQYVTNDVKMYRISDVSFQFAAEFARRMRVDRNLAPSTIRARVGLLKRAWTWYHAHNATGIKENPFGMLPDGYSIANAAEKAQILENDGEEKEDQQRNRRLDTHEYQRIIRVLRGEKLNPNRERSLASSKELEVMFRLICNTGLRMREAYRLTVGCVDLKSKQLMVGGTKGHRGRKKPRQVFMIRHVRVMLRAWISRLPFGEIRLFPKTWDGSNYPQDSTRTSNNLSHIFAGIFHDAMVYDIVQHDLRHEATCRWILMRHPKNPHAWALDKVAIAKLMGWSSLAMFLRYASLRGDDVADELKGL